MKYYIIAGEASGDLHASNLIKEINKLDRQAEFRGFGGDLMQEAGAHISLHYSQMAFMGVWEVITNLKSINKNFEICREDIKAFAPDALILVDYAGFNLRMAKFAKELGIETHFYIAPKVWAWKKSRIKNIKKYVDHLYGILPFEVEFFKKNGVHMEFHGNPLVDAIESFAAKNKETFYSENQLEEKPILALLAGSRKQEIKRCLPEMIKAADKFPDYQMVIAGAPSMPESYYKQHMGNSQAKIVFGQTYDLLNQAHSAIVTSGTATLETALFKVPEVVIYKTSPMTYIIARPFVWIKFFSLVNIIMDREVVKELLQFNLAKKIKKEMAAIIFDQDYRQAMLSQFDKLSQMMGNSGVSERVASSIFSHVKKQG